GRLPFGKRWDDEGLVPPAIVPCPGVGHFPVALLPLLRFFASANQRKRRAGRYRDVGASNDFKQAESVRHLFVTPLVSTDHRDPKHLDLRRLDHYEERLQVAATGTGAVFVDDDLAARLGGGKTGREQDYRQRKDRRAFEGMQTMMGTKFHKGAPRLGPR